MLVAILGQSGMIGQTYLSLLKEHPWFTLCDDPREAALIFSALPDHVAQEVETQLVQSGKVVISSAACHRLNPDVPLIIPEVNPHHLKQLAGKKGFLVAKPNCSIQSFLLPLTPLHQKFGVTKIHVTTLQSLSGAGKIGLSDPDYQDNVIPYIPLEEEKSEQEPAKIWDCPELVISAHCNRVPVTYGHHACISVAFERKPTEEEILESWKNFKQPHDLPSAPNLPVVYESDLSRPQTRLDRDYEKGMGVTCGRLRPCPLFDYRFVALSHNTIRGGAGGGLLIAELLYKEGYLDQTES